MTRMPNLYPYFMENCSSYYPCFGGSKIHTLAHSLARSFLVNEWMNECRAEWNRKNEKLKEKQADGTHSHDVSRVLRNRRRVQWHTHHVHVCFVLFCFRIPAHQHHHIASHHFTLHRFTSSHLTWPHFISHFFSWLSFGSLSVVTDFRLEFT